MRHTTSYDSRYAADPFHGLTSYGDFAQGEGPPPSEGFENRKTGDHPPNKPISNREKQIVEQHARVQAEYQNKTLLPPAVRTAVLRTNDSVLDALRDSSRLLGVRTYHRCLLYSRGDARWLDRADYRIGGCGKWDDVIKATELNLDRALRDAAAYEVPDAAGVKAGDKLAEISVSIADQSTTAQEGATDSTSPGGKDGTWWDETPEWVKMLAYGTGTLVVARVLLPPLFGTYLASRQDRAV